MAGPHHCFMIVLVHSLALGNILLHGRKWRVSPWSCGKHGGPWSWLHVFLDRFCPLEYGRPSQVEMAGGLVHGLTGGILPGTFLAGCEPGVCRIVKDGGRVCVGRKMVSAGLPYDPPNQTGGRIGHSQSVEPGLVG